MGVTWKLNQSRREMTVRAVVTARFALGEAACSNTAHAVLFTIRPSFVERSLQVFVFLYSSLAGPHLAYLYQACWSYRDKGTLRWERL